MYSESPVNDGQHATVLQYMQYQVRYDPKCGAVCTYWVCSTVCMRRTYSTVHCKNKFRVEFYWCVRASKVRVFAPGQRPGLLD